MVHTPPSPKNSKGRKGVPFSSASADRGKEKKRGTYAFTRRNVIKPTGEKKRGRKQASLSHP